MIIFALQVEEGEHDGPSADVSTTDRLITHKVPMGNAFRMEAKRKKVENTRNFMTGVYSVGESGEEERGQPKVLI